MPSDRISVAAATIIYLTRRSAGEMVPTIIMLKIISTTLYSGPTWGYPQGVADMFVASNVRGRQYWELWDRGRSELRD
jgi:hypothetical protein